ncbi:hypothetical protein BDQ17DRAFT_171665 [Cyathus striatus]|nr:hypothetical protein BDQ17DRAFT_171665 [Cyathus striatus]
MSKTQPSILHRCELEFRCKNGAVTVEPDSRQILIVESTSEPTSNQSVVGVRICLESTTLTPPIVWQHSSPRLFHHHPKDSGFRSVQMHWPIRSFVLSFLAGVAASQLISELPLIVKSPYLQSWIDASSVLRLARCFGLDSTWDGHRTFK